MFYMRIRRIEAFVIPIKLNVVGKVARAFPRRLEYPQRIITKPSKNLKEIGNVSRVAISLNRAIVKYE